MRLGQGSSSVFLSLWMSSGPSCPSSADLLLHLSKMSRTHVCPTRPCVRLCAASAVLVTAATQKVWRDAERFLPACCSLQTVWLLEWLSAWLSEQLYLYSQRSRCDCNRVLLELYKNERGWHLYCVEASDPRTQNVSPCAEMRSDFFNECLRVFIKLVPYIIC